MPEITGRLRPPRLAVSPATPVLGEQFYSTVDNQFYFWNGTIWVPAGPPPLVTSLPGSPVDGQEVYYLADDANGIIWHLRYRAARADAYKWEYVGGPPMAAAVSPQAGVSGNFGATGDILPNIQLPMLAGYFIIQFGSNAYSLHTATQTVTHALAYSGLEADPAAGISYVLAASGGPGRNNAMRQNVALLAAGVNVRTRGSASAGGSAYLTDRWISIIPSRVG
jgi:hypothetical protein